MDHIRLASPAVSPQAWDRWCGTLKDQKAMGVAVRAKMLLDQAMALLEAGDLVVTAAYLGTALDALKEETESFDSGDGSSSLDT